MTQIILTYNGENITTTATTISQLLQQYNITEHSKGIAVAQNRSVISRTKWHKTPIAQGDIIEVIRPFQGG